MRDFIHFCAAHDEERDLLTLRDASVIFIGQYYYSEEMKHVKEALAGILHCAALYAHVTNVSLDETPPRMSLLDARSTLVEVWGRTDAPSLQVLMIYSAISSLIPLYGFTLKEIQLFWKGRLETL